jgi:hypothetical protein
MTISDCGLRNTLIQNPVRNVGFKIQNKLIINDL